MPASSAVSATGTVNNLIRNDADGVTGGHAANADINIFSGK